jgi:serine/threonine-protein kinase
MGTLNVETRERGGLPAMEPTSAPLKGQTFGKCRLLELIGRGGMGSVYLAEHLFLRRRVAIKVLSRDLSAQPEAVERFEREAIASAKLDHPNIVRIHDVDEEDGRPYIVMEFVEGEDLEDVLQREAPLPVKRSVEIAREVALALDHAHRAGLVHRDVTPGNVLLARDGRIKITDFGLAMPANKADVNEDGTVMGTPFYVSPEQAQGLPADGRSDLYSLGTVLFQMLTGERPFEGKSPVSIVRKHLDTRRPTPLKKRPHLPPALGAIVRRLIALKPEDRYPDAASLVKDLDLVLAGKAFLRLSARPPAALAADSPPRARRTQKKS